MRLDPPLEESVLRRIGEVPGVEIGAGAGAGWPVVTETDSLEETEDLAERIRGITGVLSFTLVYHNFEDQPGMEESPTHEK